MKTRTQIHREIAALERQLEGTHENISRGMITEQIRMLRWVLRWKRKKEKNTTRMS